MAEERIPMREVMCKTITNIYCKYGKYDDWLDTAKCFIELDHQLYISIPYGEETESVWKTERIDLPPEAEKLMIDSSIKRKIVDYLWVKEDMDKGIFELDNGAFISETDVSQPGTGLEGLHFYEDLNKLKERRRGDLIRYSDVVKDI